MSWNYRIIHDTSKEDEERWYVAEYYEGPQAFGGVVALVEWADDGLEKEHQEQSALTSLRWQLAHIPLALDKPIIHWDGKTQRETK